MNKKHEEIINYLKNRVDYFYKISEEYADAVSRPNVDPETHRSLMEACRLNGVLYDEFRVSLSYIEKILRQ